MSVNPWSVPLPLITQITPTDWYDHNSLVQIYMYKTIDGTLSCAEEILYLDYNINQNIADVHPIIVVVSPQIGKTMTFYGGYGVVSIYRDGHLELRSTMTDYIVEEHGGTSQFFKIDGALKYKLAEIFDS